MEIYKFNPVRSTGRTFKTLYSLRSKVVTLVEGSFDVSWCKEGYHVPEFGLMIKGSEGKIMVDDDVVKLEPVSGKSMHWYRQDLNDNVGFLLGAPEYFREDEYFVKSILNGVNPEPSFDTASKVDYIIGKVLEGVERK